MKLTDKIRKDRQAFSALEGLQKWYFIWDYYKIPIIAVGAALVILLLSLLTGADSRKTALYAVFLNCDNVYQEADAEGLDTLLAEGGVDMKGKTIDITANLTLGQALDESYDGQTIQVLAAMFGISGLDVFAAEEESFQKYAVQDAFVDLSLFLEPELLEGQTLYRYKNSDGVEIVGGIVLTGDSPLHTAGYYCRDVVVGIAGNAQNLDEAVIFLRQLISRGKD